MEQSGTSDSTTAKLGKKGRNQSIHSNGRLHYLEVEIHMGEIMDELFALVMENDYRNIERLTAQLISESFENPMFAWEWKDDPRREAIIFSLTYLYTRPNDEMIQDVGDIFTFMSNTEAFIEYIRFIETSEGITGWIRLYNELAEYHHVDIEIPDTLLAGYEAFVEMNDFQHPLLDAMSHFFVNTEKDEDFEVVEVAETEEVFGEGFAEEWA